MNKILRLFLIAIIFIFSVGIANAGFVGNTMEVHQYTPPSPFFGSGGIHDSVTFEVDDSVELPSYGPFNQGSIDVSDDNISIGFLSGPGSIYFDSGYYVFQDINSTISEITDVSLNPSSAGFLTSWGSPAVFDPSRITFNPDEIRIDFTGLGADANSLLSLDVSFNAVPIPSGVWLLGPALIGIISIKHKFSR